MLTEYYLKQKLYQVGLRPTKQRLSILEFLYSKGFCHVSAEELFALLKEKNNDFSLATIYNTLHQFAQKKLIAKVCVTPWRIYFDTNLTPHYHLYDMHKGILTDVPLDYISVSFHKTKMNFLKDLKNYQTELIILY